MDKTPSKTPTREANGQYNHGLDRVCKCGRRKGEHLAVRPYPMEDEDDCPRFRAIKTK